MYCLDEHKRQEIIGRQEHLPVGPVATMRLRNFVVLALCWALIGCTTADEHPNATAATFNRSPTAWQFISTNPSLAATTSVLNRLGLSNALNGRFKGTLILPTDNAYNSYVSVMFTELMAYHLEEQGFFEAFMRPLMEYHMLSRRITTRQVRSVNANTNHIKEPSYAGWYRGYASNYHTLQFVVSNSRLPPINLRANPANVSTSTFREANFIRDEQGNMVTFAARNIPVYGGGVIHMVNAVLQPSDIYPSLRQLLQTDPELSISAEVLDDLNYGDLNMTDPRYWSDNCTTYCLGYDFTCQPASACNYYPDARRVGPDPTNQTVSSQALNRQLRPSMQSAIGELSVYKGTLALPTNAAFGGLPQPIEPRLWRPVVQFHFVGAASSRQLMNLANGAFPREPANPGVSYLAVARGDENNPMYKLLYRSTSGALSVDYTRSNGVPGRVAITTESLKAPGHFYYKVNSCMIGPGLTDVCRKP